MRSVCCELSHSHAAASGRSLFGDAIFGIFLLAQFCDGALTYLGIHAFGPAIEANPIVAWYVGAVGIGVGILVMKMLAVACAMLLHVSARHRTIGLLTLGYLVLAVWPWTALLASAEP